MLPYLLAYCRVQGCLLTLPVFSERLLPPRIKISLAMAMTPLLQSWRGGLRRRRSGMSRLWSWWKR
ncbi:flagellar biosynthetic protein FliR [Paracoccus sp. DMF-8]|uniref:flagellar biosynthetic protein FliR n=1 Tax=Paracoccus sp. DMF-8 TaxID=3019445 RepID=UPI0023E46F71|nr:flagellar biosynthetic protein FliR [Paracoccus sp. DMF-8]MDF3607268.1 flagellar biosynthetic protein FliR [Paracoccus sp. DMF-8]